MSILKYDGLLNHDPQWFACAGTYTQLAYNKDRKDQKNMSQVHLELETMVNISNLINNT